MGRDKAVIEVGGQPLAAVAGDALAGAGAAEVILIGGDRGVLGPVGLRVVDDGWPGQGPLGGLITALRVAAHDVVVVLSCDLPSVAPAAVTAVLDALADDADAAVPVVGGRRQPLLAAYRRRSLPALEDVWATGERSLRHAVARLATAPVALADPAWARNANRPADLEASGQLADPLEGQSEEGTGDQ